MRPDWKDVFEERGKIPLVDRWEEIQIAVAGGAGKHSAFIPTFGATKPVTRAITLPDGRPARSIKEFKEPESNPESRGNSRRASDNGASSSAPRNDKVIHLRCAFGPTSSGSSGRFMNRREVRIVRENPRRIMPAYLVGNIEITDPAGYEEYERESAPRSPLTGAATWSGPGGRWKCWKAIGYPSGW